MVCLSIWLCYRYTKLRRTNDYYLTYTQPTEDGTVSGGPYWLGPRNSLTKLAAVTVSARTCALRAFCWPVVSGHCNDLPPLEAPIILRIARLSLATRGLWAGGSVAGSTPLGLGPGCHPLGPSSRMPVSPLRTLNGGSIKIASPWWSRTSAGGKHY